MVWIAVSANDLTTLRGYVRAHGLVLLATQNSTGDLR